MWILAWLLVVGIFAAWLCNIKDEDVRAVIPRRVWELLAIIAFWCLAIPTLVAIGYALYWFGIWAHDVAFNLAGWKR
jgi:hypothetical protein